MGGGAAAALVRGHIQIYGGCITDEAASSSVHDYNGFTDEWDQQKSQLPQEVCDQEQ
jgi:hypothetical protein